MSYDNGNLYKILNVSPDASGSDIEYNYNLLSKINKDPKIIRDIEYAHEILNDPIFRDIYDKQGIKGVDNYILGEFEDKPQDYIIYDKDQEKLIPNTHPINQENLYNEIANYLIDYRQGNIKSDAEDISETESIYSDDYNSEYEDTEEENEESEYEIDQEFLQGLSDDIEYIDRAESVGRHLRTKPKSSYPDYINDEIKMITFMPDKTGKSGKYHDVKLYGSVSYMFQKYPGDIDLTEFDAKKLSKEKMIEAFAKNVQRVVKDIIKKKLHYFVEFKAGKDDRFDVDIGKLQNGFFTINPKLEKITKKLYHQKLFTKTEYKIVFDIYSKSNKTELDYDILKQLFREKIILRWTQEEVLNGRKELPSKIVNGKKKKYFIDLTEALDMEGHIKIDMVVYLNNEFVEVTNFVFLGYVEQDGTIVGINIDRKKYMDTITDNMRENIEEVCFNHFKYSPFKAAKRIYALCRIEYMQNRGMSSLHYIDKILPLLESNIGIMYQCKSEIGSIIRVFDTHDNFPIKSVNHQLQDIKYRLANMYQLRDNILEHINELIDTATNKKKKDEKKKIIEYISSQLEGLINYFTIEYYNENGLNPIPRDLLPKNMKYTYEKLSFDDDLSIINL